MTDFKPGDRVMIHWDGVPNASPWGRHLQRDLPLRGAVGVVDRLDDLYADHLAIVVWPTITIPPLGHAWTDEYGHDEVVHFR